MGTVRLHLVGFPHTRVTPDFATCAYTQKVAKLQRMAATHGWELTVYATEGSDDAVACLSDAERTGIFGPDDPNNLPAWPSDEQWATFNARAVREIRERAEPHDLLLLAAGWSQRQVQAELPHLICLEPGVGYEGILHVSHCAFESAAWMHHVYGLKAIRDGRWFDRVIPNYFDPDDFPYVSDGSGEYLLYVGRLIGRKGVGTAVDIAKATGRQLRIAGPGAITHGAGTIVMNEGVMNGPIEYLGTLDPVTRAEAMAGAWAVLVPTTYIEPFGGVAVEAMMCGTPVISTDWGAFRETVTEGVSGFRFRTLVEAAEAVHRVAELDRFSVRQYALDHYSLDAVAPQFQSWFDQIGTLWADGWYDETYDFSESPEAVTA
jgi:glycosyltransferase involved in cell wall biosynthesis